MQDDGSLDASFGKRSVTAAERRQRIGLVFRAVAQEPQACRYLVESIRRFPDRQDLSAFGGKSPTS